MGHNMAGQGHEHMTSSGGPRASFLVHDGAKGLRRGRRPPTQPTRRSQTRPISTRPDGRLLDSGLRLLFSDHCFQLTKPASRVRSGMATKREGDGSLRTAIPVVILL
jgi:hypothetical protein